MRVLVDCEQHLARRVGATVMRDALDLVLAGKALSQPPLAS